MKSTVTFVLGFFCFIVEATAQKFSDSIDTFCSYNPGSICGSKFELNFYELSDTTSIKKALYNVLNELGVNRKVFVGKFNDKSNNGIFFKLKEDNTARVLVSQKYLNQTWIALGILFHELGHYINDHENFCSNKELELDADYYAGYCLSRAGASSSEAIQSLSTLPEEGDETHPPKKDREQRVLKGWADEKKAKGINSFTSITPTVIWNNMEDSVNVLIDDHAISFERTKYLIHKVVQSDTVLTFDPQFGMLYVKSTNSTYQLIDYNYKKNYEGIGELINDRTSLVYTRFDNNHWRYYNRGKIISQEETSPIGRRDANYVVSYQGKVISLKNFRYAPLKRLMPALYQ